MQKIGKLTADWAESQLLRCQYESLVGSTNDIGKSLPQAERQQPILILADSQSGGRGRYDRKWITDNSMGHLLSSWCLPLSKSPHPLATLKIGHALYRSLNRCWPQKNFRLKAPNDLFRDNKKFAGLLVESLVSAQSSAEDKEKTNIWLVVGLGLNVTAAPHLPTEATQLLDNSGDLESFEIQTWNEFLTGWWEGLNKIKFDTPYLTEVERQGLVNAMNSSNTLEDKVMNISPVGDIVFSSGRQIKAFDL